MDKSVTENAVDLIKTATAMGPPASAALFGISLEEWMFIASIVASLFIVLDKLPAILGRLSAKFKKQSSNSGDGNADADSSG